MKTKTKAFPVNDTFVEIDGWDGKFLLGKNHSYWWKEEGKEPRPLSGITSVLGVIGKPALLPWAAKMTVEYIKANGQKEISTDGTDCWLVDDEDLEAARIAHTKRKEAAGDLGTNAHALIEEWIKACIDSYEGKPIAPLANDAPRVKEFSDWAVGENITFLASETPLADPEFSIAGTPDFIAKRLIVNGEEIIIGDIKTGSGIYDRTPFLQMAAYGYMYLTNKAPTYPSMVIAHMPAQKPEQAMKTYWSHDWAGDYDLFMSALTLYRGINNFTK